MRRALNVLGFLCGWLVLYIALGSLLSFAFDDRPYTTQLDCIPHGSMFGVLEANCANLAAKLLWYVLVEWPRFVIVFPSMQVAMVHAFTNDGMTRWGYLYNAVPFFVGSVPLALAVCGSVLHWKRRSNAFAAAQVAVLLAEIGYLGLHI